MSSSDPSFSFRFVRLIASWMGIISLLCLPPIFSHVFAVATLLPNENILLWCFSLALMLFTLLIYSSALSINRRLSALLGAALFLMSLELIIRLCIVGFADEATLYKLGKAANRTYPELMAYQGHPFVQYTGFPNVNAEDWENARPLHSFNNRGFHGRNFTYEKPEGVIRIAALGGSTTAFGYPEVMEKMLNDSISGNSVQFEVFNFGLSNWTTAQSSVNFALNVIAYDPDYVIVHHGWNDLSIRGTPPDQFRNDYSHALTSFRKPFIPDRWPVRISVIYRILRYNIATEPNQPFPANVSLKKDRELIKPLSANLDELIPFERNILNIIDIADAYDIRVILSTQPHSVDPDVHMAFAVPHIEQCNDIMRKLAHTDSSKVALLDLDSLMTNHMDHVFKDVGHMTDEGILFKANKFGNLILKLEFQSSIQKPINYEP